MLRQIQLALTLAALAALAASGAAAAELDLEVRPAWDGLARPGRWSEVQVRVVAERGGELTLELLGSGVRSRLSARVEAGEPARLRVPAWPPATGDLRLVVRGPGGAVEEREVPLRRVAPDRKLVAWVGTFARTQAPDAPAPGLRRVTPDPASLPVHARAYEAVDALVIDSGALAALETPQLRAFESHLASCGRVLLAGASEAALARGRQRAGCGGVFFRVAGAEGLAPALQALLARAPRPLPGPDELALRPSGGRRPAAEAALMSFFGLYAAALLLGGVALRRPAGIVALPLAASALLLLGFRASPPDVSVSAWSEAVGGSAEARFAALLRVEGMAPGEWAVDLPPATGLPAPKPSGSGLTLHLAPDIGGPLRAAMPTRLLSAEALLLRGSATGVPRLRIDGRGGDARVHNPGPATTGPGYLLDGAQTWALPQLPAGARFRARDAEPLERGALPGWLARAPRGPEELAVLVPYAPEVLAGVVAGALPHGWLAIRPGERP